MKKSFSKVCIRTILTYFVIISVIILLKIINIDYFGIKYDNNMINKFAEFVVSHKLENIWYSITLYIYTYIILSISCKDRSKKMKIYALIVTLIGIPFKFFTNYIKNIIPLLKAILEILFMFVPIIIYQKSFKKGLKNGFVAILLNCMFQIITSFCKNVDLYIINEFVTNIMFDIDQILIMLLFYYYYFERKEVRDIWEMVVGSLLDLWHGFMQLPVSFLELSRHLIYGLKKQLSTIKKVLKSRKREKIDNIAFLSIYYLLTLFWNIFTIVLIVLIARINNVAITIVFIMFAFLFNKGKFGKSLHLKSAFWCFIISNISYYFISRLTLPIGTSYLVPILIGVCMSYYTSLLVKYTTKELYKGINEEELREICLLKGLDEYKIKFLTDIYCNNMNYVQLHFKYKYSLDRLRHMKMKYLKELKNS